MLLPCLSHPGSSRLLEIPLVTWCLSVIQEGARNELPSVLLVFLQSFFNHSGSSHCLVIPLDPLCVSAIQKTMRNNLSFVVMVSRGAGVLPRPQAAVGSGYMWGRGRGHTGSVSPAWCERRPSHPLTAAVSAVALRVFVGSLAVQIEG